MAISRLRLFPSATFLIITLGLHAFGGTGAAIPDEIASALNGSAALLMPIHIEFSAQNVPALPPDQAIKQLELQDGLAVATFRKYDVAVIWQGGKAYHRQFGKLNGEVPNPSHLLDPATNITSFDGKLFYSANADPPAPPLSEHPSVSARPMTDEPASGSFFSDEYLARAGYETPSLPADIIAKRPARSLVLALLDRGARLEGIDVATVDGQKLVRLRLIGVNLDWQRADQADLLGVEEAFRGQAGGTEGYAAAEVGAVRAARQLPHEREYLFYFDATLHFAMRRSEERYADGRLLIQTTCDDFQQVPGRDLWLPHNITVYHFSWDTEPALIFNTPAIATRFAVSLVSTEPVPDSRFVIHYTTPGAIDSTGTSTEPEGFVVPATVDGLTAAAENARKLVMTASPAPGTSDIPFWALFVGFNAACAATAVLCLRRPRKPPSV